MERISLTTLRKKLASERANQLQVLLPRIFQSHTHSSYTLYSAVSIIITLLTVRVSAFYCLEEC